MSDEGALPDKNLAEADTKPIVVVEPEAGPAVPVITARDSEGNIIPPDQVPKEIAEVAQEIADRPPPEAEYYRCRAGHVTVGEFSYSSSDAITKEVEGETGPICRICMLSWARRMFEARRISPEAAKALRERRERRQAKKGGDRPS